MSKGRITPRSILAALALLVGINALMRTCEFVMGRYITAGVPPVAAVGGLFVLLAINAVLRGPLERYRFTRAELLTAYAGLCIGCAITATYGIRSILPYFSALAYYAQPTNQFEQFADSLPAWYALSDPDAIKGLYEGMPGSGVPWRAWRGVFVGWGSFLAMIFIGVACLTSILRRPWMEHDRLMFPVTQLPLALTQPGLRLWVNPFFWAGFLLVAIINASNIGHAFIEAVPAIKPTIAIPEMGPPFQHLRSMTLFNRPEIYGFAYWVPGEILFSGWLSYVAVRLFAVGGVMAGLEQPGFPFTQEQATGGYFAFALFLLWGIKGHLRGLFAGLLSRDRDDDREPLGYRWATVGLVVSAVYCGWFLTTGGVPGWLAYAYVGVILIFTLVYARLRVEAGLALEFVYPYGYPKRVFLQVFGSDTILISGHGPQGLTAFYVAGFLARFHHAFWIGGYCLEGMRLAEAARVRQRRQLAWLTAIFAIGAVLAVANYLTYNYEHGLNYFEGKPGTADWRTATVVREYQELNNHVLKAQPTDRTRLLYTIAGAVITGILAVGRRASVGFPLHPVGYLLATSYGETSPMWFPFFVVWALKTMLLRYGGLRLFRRFMPFFVGIIVGHYLVGGLFWSILSASATPDIAHRYYTIFG